MRTGRIPAPPPVPEDDNRLTTMKKYLLLLLLGTFLCACSSDDGEGIPFVTDVVMPSEARTFAPGDEVTVSAKGFEAGDDIMLRIAWPLTNAAISEVFPVPAYPFRIKIRSCASPQRNPPRRSIAFFCAGVGSNAKFS